MKTMNFLVLIGVVLFGTSCTDYWPDHDRDSEDGETEIENVYLELDLHQIYLDNRDAQLVLEIEKVMANLEAGEGNEKDNISLLEKLQEERAGNRELFDFNKAVLSEIDKVAFIRPPKLPCSDEGDPYTICPVPRLSENQLWVFDGQEIESAIQEADSGEICGKFSGLEPVKGPDEFSMMVFEESGNGCHSKKLIVSKPNPLGEGTVSYTVYYEQ